MNKSLWIGTFCIAIFSQNLYAQPYQPMNGHFGVRGFSVGASWLHWKGHEEGLGTGVIAQSTLNSPTTNLTLIKPSFDSSNGYRLFAGFQTEDLRWRFKIIYTHMPVSSSERVADNFNSTRFINVFQNNFPLLTPVANVPFTSTSSKLKMDVNYLDLDVGNSVVGFSRCQITPHIGVRTLWLDQKYKMQFNSTPLLLSVNSHVKDKIRAIGVEGGLDGEYYLGSGFSLFGEFGGSLLYARYKDNGISQSNAVQTIPNLTYHQTIRKSLPTVDTNIGVNYTNDSCGYPFSIFASWENHIIFSTNQFSESSGNLSMQGLTLGASVNF